MRPWHLWDIPVQTDHDMTDSREMFQESLTFEGVRASLGRVSRETDGLAPHCPSPVGEAGRPLETSAPQLLIYRGQEWFWADAGVKAGELIRSGGEGQFDKLLASAFQLSKNSTLCASVLQCCHHSPKCPTTSPSGLAPWPALSVLPLATLTPRLPGRRMEAQTSLLLVSDACMSCQTTMCFSSLM